MTRRTKAAGAIALATTAGAMFATTALAADPANTLSPVAANVRADGHSPANKLSPQLFEYAVAQGATKLENPSPLTSFYGYYNDLLTPTGEPQFLPTPASPSEAGKSEPDKNTYLVFKRSLAGADAGYDYGTHFLFQGHEVSSGGKSSITRINLDADDAHRVTLLATQDVTGNPVAGIDGSTWDPFAQRLILTTENSSAPTYAATPDYPSQVTDISGAVGRGGYEGIQDDADGNLWIAEDIGGANKGATKARLPNSYLYRYVPRHRGDLAHGRLQVLQAYNNDTGDPITAESQTALNSPDQLALHTYGSSFKYQWITIHDTAKDGTAAYQALPLARAAKATPFKRPENGQFRPNGRFNQFFFDETGDTNATSPENDTAGGWGSIFELDQRDPSADGGTLRLFYKGDQVHAGFDNVAFLSRTKVAFVEDAGDTLHAQRNALDSGWLFDVNSDYSAPDAQPLRFLGEGRDPSATIDAANAGFGKNEGDNEITGIHVSNGKIGPQGILGSDAPNLSDPRWRFFWTQQHGDNTTWEVLVNPRRWDDGD